MALRTKSKDRELLRLKRHRRVRRRLEGTPERPRLVVHRSIRNIQGHLADDVSGKILMGISTLAPELKAAREEEGATKLALAKAAGKLLAEKAKAAGITKVVFDRGGYLYHGRIAAFAEGAREGGLEF
ncbi:MAG: 50S ribosomal protein L18 [Candidatus Cloacimonetes bacterium]|jgi:large subunit ribosomal protein L18|nr:50S ribosomal protein L18 [Candidatus Cloacimonadota bacterium]